VSALIFFTTLAAGWLWWQAFMGRSRERTIMLVMAIVLTIGVLWMLQFD
jgi:hypothetical protein